MITQEQLKDVKDRVEQLNRYLDIDNKKVRKPNSVVYDPKMKLKDYISEAGGYAERARKSGTFILYPNGHIKELGRNANAKDIVGGSKIIVPQKGKSQWNIGTTLSTITTSVSMLAVIASLINTMK